MSRRIPTLVAAVASLVLYFYGYKLSAVTLLAAGAAAELWFWTRVFDRRATTPSSESP